MPLAPPRGTPASGAAEAAEAGRAGGRRRRERAERRSRDEPEPEPEAEQEPVAEPGAGPADGSRPGGRRRPRRRRPRRARRHPQPATPPPPHRASATEHTVVRPRPLAPDSAAAAGSPSEARRRARRRQPLVAVPDRLGPDRGLDRDRGRLSFLLFLDRGRRRAPADPRRPGRARRDRAGRSADDPDPRLRQALEHARRPGPLGHDDAAPRRRRGRGPVRSSRCPAT